MKYSEMKLLILLEILAPEDGVDRYNLTEDAKDQMRDMINNHESMTNILELLPDGDRKDKMLQLAKTIDEEIESETKDSQEEV